MDNDEAAFLIEDANPPPSREASVKEVIDSILSLNKGVKAPELPSDMSANASEPLCKHSLFQSFSLQVNDGQSTGAGNTSLGGAANTSPTTVAYAMALEREGAASEVRDLDFMIARLKAQRQRAFARMIELEANQPKAALLHFFNPGEQVHELNVGAERVACLDVNSPFGSLVCAQGSVMTLHSLNLNTSIELKGNENKPVSCVVIRGADPVILAGAGNDLFLYPKESQTPLFYAEPSQLLGHMDRVVAVHYDGFSGVSSSLDKTVRVWDFAASKCTQILDTFAFGVCNTVQHEQILLATGTQDGVVRLWDLRTAKPERELVGGHTSPISALKFSGLELVSGAEDGSLRTWDLRNGKITLADAYAGRIASLGFDDKRIVAQIENEKMGRIVDRDTNDQRMLAITDSVITASKYLDGYFVASREGGDIGVWAV